MSDDATTDTNEDQQAPSPGGAPQPKSLIASWAQKQETPPKAQSGFQPKSLISDWSQKEGMPVTGLSTSAPIPSAKQPPIANEIEESQESSAPESNADQKRSLWAGEHVPPPSDCLASQLVRDAANSLNMTRPDRD